MLELKVSFWGEKDCDFMASGGQLVCQINERRDVSHGEPWKHGYVKLRHLR